MNKDTQPLDDRDLVPWLEEDNSEEMREQLEERDTQEAEEHYSASEPW